MRTVNTESKTEVDLIQDALGAAMDYNSYMEELSDQVNGGKTSGPVQSEAYVHYTLLNRQRMLRWDRTFRLMEEDMEKLSHLKEPLIWLVLTESWCGDAAPVLPVLNAFAENSPKIDLRIAYRDEHPDLLDLYLSNGARSIPKLLMLERNSLKVLKSWGPRPAVAQRMTDAYKAEHGVLSPEFREQLQKWYNKDKGQEIRKELLELLALK
ncbi:thioredoxin family protein [Robiginitalea sp. IMCC44478]|uniref:thioredoxin family protein n=1 Tax=Robiginitalea sp. IMCC44478 TaxID=3459122 RepID=UPI0040414DF9